MIVGCVILFVSGADMFYFTDYLLCWAFMLGLLCVV